MKNNKDCNEKKSDLEGIAFWVDSYTCHTKHDHEGNFLLNAVDAPEATEVICMWEGLDIEWSLLGPHPFKLGDRIILFNYYEEGCDSMVHAIEVIDIGPSEIKIPDSDFSHFIAYRKLKGCAPVKLSLDHVLKLRSQGLITGFADLQCRKKLSQEEWDQFVRTFKLRQAQAEPEERLNEKTS